MIDAEKVYSDNPPTSNLDQTSDNTFAFNGTFDNETAQFWQTIDWMLTPIGTPETWSSSFRISFQICFTSPLPMVIWWGKKRSLFYNPAAAALLGRQHPTTFGQAGSQAWAELWQQIGPVVDNVFATGQPQPQQTINLWTSDQQQEQRFTVAHSSIIGMSGHVEAVLTILTEVPLLVSEPKLINTSEPIDEQQKNTQYQDPKYQQLESALRISEARFKRLVETNFFGVAIGDYDGNMLYANDAFLTMTGYSREQLETGEVTWVDITPAEYLKLDWQAGEELRQHGISQPFEKEYIHKDGHRVPILIRSALLNEPNQQPEQIISFYLDLTTLKQTERTLQAALQRLNSHIENTPLAVVEWDQEMRVTRWSSNAERMFGWQAEEVIGKNFSEWQFVYEADLENVKNNIQPLLTHDASQIVCFNRNYTKDGKIIHCEWYGSSLIDANGGLSLLSLVLDVTERQQAELALRESEQRFQLATRAIEGLVFDWDLQTGEVYRSEGLYRLIGLRPDAVPQSRDWWKERLHPEDVERLRQRMPELLNSNRDRYEGEYRIRHEQGHWVDVWERGFLIRDEAGQVSRIVGITSDITDRKQAELEREQLLQRERYAREEAETANRIKDEFLAVLSHELRSPLNPILGWAKLLRSRKFDEATTDHALETIERNAKLQTQLISDLLDVSRILRGKMVLETAPVSLKTTVEAAIETVRLAAEAKNIYLQLTVDSADDSENQNSELWVIGDAARLQQIVWNLLSNAVKFTPPGGRIEVKLESYEFSILNSELNSAPPTQNLELKTQTYAKITVTDTGKGINPEFLPHVFEYFRQEDGSITRKFGGLGLGLAIVRHLTELHGGRVQVESRGEDMGATFIVQLPLLKETNLSEPLNPPHMPSNAATLAGLRLLVVDDDADIRALLAFILKQAGAEVEVAASAAEALHLLKQTSPDILISDIGMPDVDGYQFIQQVRTLPIEQGGQISAIALTAYAAERDQQQAAQAGFQQHIAKPVEPEELIAAVLAMKLRG